MNIRVLVVDDYPLVREGLAASLEADPGIDVVGRAGDGAEGMRYAHELLPDVVLLDLTMPGIGGADMLTRLRDELPQIRALVVTAKDGVESLLDAITAGAAGYLSKRVTGVGLRHAVITVYGGGSIISPELAGGLLKDYAHVARGGSLNVAPLIATRESEVLRLVSRGMTDKQIGAELFISPRTVQNHLRRLRDKTGTKRRSEMAFWAVEHAAN
jgi:DNA-binding NarL/FixJ family response regulator